MSADAAPAPAPEPAVSALDVARDLIELGLLDPHGPPLRPREPLPRLSDQVLEDGIVARAGQLGMPVLTGWRGRPSLRASDAEALIATASRAVADQAERDRRDAEASGAWHAAQAARVVTDVVSLGEAAALLGTDGLTRALAAGGTGLPAVVGEIAPAPRTHAEQLAYLRSGQAEADRIKAGIASANSPASWTGPS